MSVTMKPTNTGELSSTRIVIGLLRHYLGGRRGLIMLTVIAVAGGAFFGWGWLVAAGIAPLLLAFAPCAAMCALGLCMNKMSGKSCSAAPKPGAHNVESKSSATVSSVTANDKT